MTSLVPLGDLVLPIKRADPARLGRRKINYIDISSVDRDTKKIASPSLIEAENAPSRARQILRARDIVVATVRPNLNAVALVPLELHDAIGSTGFCVLRADQNKVLPEYIFYFTQSTSFISNLTKIANGASYPAVSDDDVLDTSIPELPLARQEEIVSALRAADHIRSIRRYALRLCDEFLPAAFLEMFGDFRLSLEGQEIAELESVAEIVSGVTKGQRYTGKDTVTVPYLRVANVQDGHLDLSEIKTITVPVSEARNLLLQAGDVLMTEGGDYDKLGRGAIWHSEINPCIHQNHIFRVRLDQSRVLPTYFASLLRTKYAKSYFLRCAKQTTNLASINMTQLKATPVPLPPLEGQKHFAAVFATHATIRTTHVEALRQANHLFQSLLHRAFNADL